MTKGSSTQSLTANPSDHGATCVVESPAAHGTLVFDELELHPAPAIEVNKSLPSIPGYELLGILGEGGMGVVYRARHLVLKREVALKMIASEHASPNARIRFQTEAETIARLRHPSFVQIYEVGEHAGRPFLALELVEGGSLSQLLQTNGPLAGRDAAQLVAVLAHAMQYAHLQGIVHRDLKPGNVLLQLPINASEVTRDKLLAARGAYEIKISDFGLAKILDADNGHTRSGSIIGTPAYMAPEQAKSKGHEVTPRTDVYALGAILFECLTGRPPFEGETGWDVIVQVGNAEPPRPSKFQPRLSRDLDTICLKCLAKDPQRRYASAAELAADLDRFANGEAISARPEGLAIKLGRKLRRRPVAIAASLLAVGSLVMAGIAWRFQFDRARGDLEEGREKLSRGQIAEAAASFQRGLDRVRRLPASRELEFELNRQWVAVNVRQLAAELLFKFDPNHLDAAQQQKLLEHARGIWQARELILGYAAGADPDWEKEIRADMRDIALWLTQAQTRVASSRDGERQAHRNAIQLLDEIESFGAPSQVVRLERQGHQRALGEATDESTAMNQPATATEYRLLGRALANLGKVEEADRCFSLGLLLDPRGLILHFDRGVLALRARRFDSAVAAFTACLAIKPDAAAFTRRGFAYLNRGDEAQRLGRGGDAQADWERGLWDFDAALKHDATDNQAYFGRAQIHRRRKELDFARRDLNAALAHGYPAAAGNYALAIVLFDSDLIEDARVRLQDALKSKPDFPAARDMLEQLSRRSPNPAKP